MIDDQDPVLRARFKALKKAESKAAPAWRSSSLDVRRPPQHSAVPLMLRWAFALLVLSSAFVLWPRQPLHRLADLPPLYESSQHGLFVGMAPGSTDFLLPSHLNITLP